MDGCLINAYAGSGPGDVPYKYLDSHGLTDEFLRRSRVLIIKLQKLFATVGDLHKVSLTEFIGLPLFASWAIEWEWEGLPPELATLAHKWNEKRDIAHARQAAPMTPAPASEPVTPAISAPDTSSSSKKTVHRERKNVLDAPIVKAIAAAKSLVTAAVFAHLVEIALKEEVPFTGSVDTKGIYYNDGGKVKILSKPALAKRLKGHTLPLNIGG